jgi:glycosyltransferase involved in cell wall biosynthesis
MKVLFCGTHPNLDSGYANVVYNLFLNVQKIGVTSCQFVLFAFDAQATTLDRARDLGMKIVSPFRETGEPFGESLLAKTVERERPNAVVIYNDLLVVNRLLDSLDQSTHRPERVVIYLDLVYEYQNKRMIQQILDRSNLVMLFTDHWTRHLREMFPSCLVPMETLDHGLRQELLTTLGTEEIARAKRDLGIPSDGLVILNLNRNSLRKRWDLTVKSFIGFLEKEFGRSGEKAKKQPAYLYVGCTLQKDNPAVTYNLLDIIETECHYRKLKTEEIMPFFIFKGSHHMSDREINMLYNCCDIGLNTCAGEGFGLCNFEHGYLGKPQIVSHVGGLSSCVKGAYFIKPVSYQYSIEGVGGMAYDFDHRDIVDALQFYYRHPEMRTIDGQRIRNYIESNDKYSWKRIAQKFVDCVTTGGAAGNP